MEANAQGICISSCSTSHPDKIRSGMALIQLSCAGLPKLRGAGSRGQLVWQQVQKACRHHQALHDPHKGWEFIVFSCAGVPKLRGAGGRGQLVLQQVQETCTSQQEAGPVDHTRSAGGASQALLLHPASQGQAGCESGISSGELGPVRVPSSAPGAAQEHAAHACYCLLHIISFFNQLIFCSWGQQGTNRQSNHTVNIQTNLNRLWCSQ